MPDTLNLFNILLLIASFLLVVAYTLTRNKFSILEKKNSQLIGWQKAVLNSADYSVISTDINGVIATFNTKAEEMLGYSADEVIGKMTPEVIHNRAEIEAYAIKLSDEYNKEIAPGFEVFTERVKSGGVDEREWLYIRKDGKQIPVILSVTAIKSSSNKIVGYLGIATDLTERKAMQANLRELSQRYETLFENSADAISLMDSFGNFVVCNSAMVHLFDYPKNEIIDKNLVHFSPFKQPNGIESKVLADRYIKEALQGKKQLFEWQHIKPDGSLYDVEVSLNKVLINKHTYLQTIVRDVTERKQLFERLSYQARNDSLTNLPNRKAFNEVLKQKIVRAKVLDCELYVMLLDFNNFKEVNDTLGHQFGDYVLEKVGARLSNFSKSHDAFISRLGGDEFALISPVSIEFDKANELVELLLDSLRKPFEVNGFNISLSASVGISRYPEHGENCDELLRTADVAMYHAKMNSFSIQLYNQHIDNHSKQKLGLVSELKNAISEEQLILHYQPKLDLKTNKISGFEALVRWNHPQQGLLYPDSFIDLVEMSEIVHSFTNAIIEIAVKDKKKMAELGIKEPIAINLSARNLVDSSCLAFLQRCLEEHELPASQIEIEVTETAVMYDSESAVTLLNEFNKLGVKVMIDDFGTGYSSLYYLRQLPVSALKIDRSFVTEMNSNPQDSAIVISTISLAHSLNIEVVAEGVEDMDTMNVLAEKECDYAQGYGICMPIDFDALMKWIKDQNQISS